MNKCLIASAALLTAISTNATAATNLVTNGNFSATSTPSVNGNFQLTAGGTYGTVTGWATTGGYNLLFNTSNATTAAGNAYGLFASNGSTTAKEYLNSLPSGGAMGNFVALDGDTDFTAAITQAINGLVNGQKYTIEFDWSANSLASRQGALTDGLTTTINGQTFTTIQAPIPSGWTHQSYTFTYNSSANNILSFLSTGTPNGLPPVALLDNVSLTAAVPEPATWGMMIVGFGAVGATMRRRRATTVRFA